MMAEALAQAELDWRFLSFEVNEIQLAQAISGLEVLGFRGVTLAGAYRNAASGIASQLTPRAKLSGSINCLTLHEGKLLGDDTCGAAFVEAAARQLPMTETHLLVIGSGRVARSIAMAGVTAGLKALHLADGSDPQLEALREDVAAEAADETAVATHSIEKSLTIPADTNVVVFAPEDADFDSPKLKIAQENSLLHLFDTRPASSRTDFLKWGAEQGATIVEGVDLLARETALILELWTGLTFDRAPLREAAEEFLGV